MQVVQLVKVLRSCQMPNHILSILKDLYRTDEYTLLDGDKPASVQPSFGVRQGCALSPLLFAIFLKDINSVADKVKGTLTGAPTNFLVTHICLQTTFPSCPSTLTTCRHVEQTKRVRTKTVFYCQYTKV